MIPEGYKSPSGKYDGPERREMSNEQQMQLNNAIIKMEVMANKFDTMEKNMASFIADMKDYQAKAMHQSRQDYEYLDNKIDKKHSEVADVARSALKKVDDHILLTQNDKEHKKAGIDWVKWIPGTIFGVIAMIIALLKFGGQ